MGHPEEQRRDEDHERKRAVRAQQDAAYARPVNHLLEQRREHDVADVEAVPEVAEEPRHARDLGVCGRTLSHRQCQRNRGSEEQELDGREGARHADTPVERHAQPEERRGLALRAGGSLGECPYERVPGRQKQEGGVRHRARGSRRCAEEPALDLCVAATCWGLCGRARLTPVWGGRGAAAPCPARRTATAQACSTGRPPRRHRGEG